MKKTVLRAKALIEKLPKDATVIELAGPTPPGNEFLKSHKIKLQAKPLITNRENPARFYGLPPHPKLIPVDEIADVRQLHYRSVDLFLCSYLTWYDWHKGAKQNRWKQWLARLHYVLKYTDSRANLHIALFRETARSLKPGGLLLVEGVRKADYAIAKKCGFEVVHRDEDDDWSTALFQNLSSPENKAN